MTIPPKRFNRGGPIPRVNVARHEKEWARTFHSLERCAFTKSRGCAVCGARPSENAHSENDGKGRRGDFDTILPLCRKHHSELDAGEGREAFEAKYELSLAEEAAKLQAAWLVYAEREGLDP